MLACGGARESQCALIIPGRRGGSQSWLQLENHTAHTKGAEEKASTCSFHSLPAHLAVCGADPDGVLAVLSLQRQTRGQAGLCKQIKLSNTR